MATTFAGKVTRSTKQARGRTALETTPVAIRSSFRLPPKLEDKIRSKLARRIGHAAPLIERGTVRFEDINGPRGGVDVVCRIKLVLSGRPSVQAQERASDAEPAFDLASHKVQRALERTRGKHELAAGSRYRGKGATKRPATRAKTAPATTRAHEPPERAPMKLKTARQPPARRAAKAKAPQAKRRHRVQRGARR